MEGSKEHKRKKEGDGASWRPASCVTGCWLYAQTLTGHLTPLTSTRVRQQWRALLVCFGEVELNPHTPPVSGFASVFLRFGCFLAVWVDYWTRTTRKLRLSIVELPETASY